MAINLVVPVSVSAIASDANKIDDEAVSGLLGTYDSLAYRVHEIERHLHSAGSWFGQASSANPTTHVANRTGVGISAF